MRYPGWHCAPSCDTGCQDVGLDAVTHCEAQPDDAAHGALEDEEADEHIAQSIVTVHGMVEGDGEEAVNQGPLDDSRRGYSGARAGACCCAHADDVGWVRF